MFRALFLAFLAATLTVNIIFLFATKDKPPDVAGSTTLVSAVVGAGRDEAAPAPAQQQQRRRLFLRSNDFYDYSAPSTSAPPPPGQWSVAPVQAEPAAAANKSREALTTFAYDNYNSAAATMTPSAAPPGELMLARNGSLAPTSDNEITRAEGRRRRIRLRVKSSRGHVLVSLDDSIIYQSGTGAAGAFRAWRARRHNGDANGRRAQRQQSSFAANSPGDFGPVERKRREQEQKQEEEEEDEQEDARALEESERGIHVLVLSQYDGSIMSQRLFDTYSSQQDAELALHLSSIQAGRLLVFAVRDEASFKMAPNSLARRHLKALGSRHISRLGWRDMWAMVAVKRDLLETAGQIGAGGRARDASDNKSPGCLAEAISHSAGFAQWGAPVTIEASFELLAPPPTPLGVECVGWSARRRAFCARIEGYGRVCDCRRPSPIEFAPAPIENSRLSGVPIVVIASNRPHYLHRMLKSLLQARGLNATMVTVFIDGAHREPAAVCQLLGLRHVQRTARGHRAARISNHYKLSLSETFLELFPQARHAIIFEEDLDVAPDALLYFNAALPLLERDSSLYCASAWNDQGYEHSVGSLSELYRVETMPGLGWLLARELFVEELQPSWPAASQPHDWDMWIRTRAVRRGRECLIPDVSRTYHFGARGTNINAHFQRQYFSKHAFSANYLDSVASAPAAISTFGHLEALEAEAYDAQLERTISERARWIGWEVARDEDDPSKRRPLVNETLRAQLELQYLCSLANLTHYFEPATLSAGGNKPDETRRGDNNNNEAPRTNVIFVKMIDGEDFANWLQLASCWRLWDLDARGQHKATWRLYLSGQPTLVVGHPASPFSRLKPAGLIPFDLRPISAPPPPLERAALERARRRRAGQPKVRPASES